MNLKGIVLSEQANLTKSRMHASIYMTFWKKWNDSDGEEISGCQGPVQRTLGVMETFCCSGYTNYVLEFIEP